MPLDDHSTKKPFYFMELKFSISKKNLRSARTFNCQLAFASMVATQVTTNIQFDFFANNLSLSIVLKIKFSRATREPELLTHMTKAYNHPSKSSFISVVIEFFAKIYQVKIIFTLATREFVISYQLLAWLKHR